MSAKPDAHNAFLEDRIRKAAKMVNRWYGRPAGMFSLRSAHAALNIVVFGEEAGRNLVITCVHPEHICGPFRWRDSQIRIRVTQLKSGAGAAVVD
jgi:hypothetical protein